MSSQGKDGPKKGAKANGKNKTKKAKPSSPSSSTITATTATTTPTTTTKASPPQQKPKVKAPKPAASATAGGATPATKPQTKGKAASPTATLAAAAAKLSPQQAKALANAAPAVVASLVPTAAPQPTVAIPPAKPTARFGRKERPAAPPQAVSQPQVIADSTPSPQQQPQQQQQVVFVESKVPEQAQKFAAPIASTGKKGKQAQAGVTGQAVGKGGKQGKQEPDLSQAYFAFIPSNQVDSDPTLQTRLKDALDDVLANGRTKPGKWHKVCSYFAITDSVTRITFHGFDPETRSVVHRAAHAVSMTSDSAGGGDDRILTLSKPLGDGKGGGTQYTKDIVKFVIDLIAKEYPPVKDYFAPAKPQKAPQEQSQSQQQSNNTNNGGKSNHYDKYLGDTDFKTVEPSVPNGIIDETLALPAQQVLNKLILQYHDHLNYPLYTTTQPPKPESDQQTTTTLQDNSTALVDSDQYRVTGLKDIISSDLTDYTQFSRDLRSLHSEQLDALKQLHTKLRTTRANLSTKLMNRHGGNQAVVQQNPEMQRLGDELESLGQVMLHHQNEIETPEDISILSSDLFINPHVCSSNCQMDQKHYEQVMGDDKNKNNNNDLANVLNATNVTKHPNLVKKECYRKYANITTREWEPKDDELEKDPSLTYHSKGELRKQLQIARDRITIENASANDGNEKASNSNEKGKAKKNKTVKAVMEKNASTRHAAPSDPVVLALPVRTHAARVLHALHHNNVVVVVGQTGSGKSTQIPQLIFEHFHRCKLCRESHGKESKDDDKHDNHGKKGKDHNSHDRFADAQILCTQPRRLAAISLAQRVADERGELHHIQDEKKIAQKKLKEQQRLIQSGVGGGDLLDDNNEANQNGSSELVGVDLGGDELKMFSPDAADDVVDGDAYDHYNGGDDEDHDDGAEFEVASDVELDDDGKDGKDSNNRQQQKDNKQEAPEDESKVQISKTSIVGYAVKNQNQNPHANIVYCTSGLFLRRITMNAGDRSAPQQRRSLTMNNFGSLAHFNPLFSKWMQCHDNVTSAFKASEADGVITAETTTTPAITTTTTTTTAHGKAPTTNQLKSLSTKAMQLFTSVYSPFVHRLLFALRKYTHIIIDEAHERDKLIDFTLVLLKVALLIRKDLKVVIMSATINSSLFSDYFNAPIINIEGRTFPVDVMYMHHGAYLSEVALANRSDRSSLYAINASGTGMGQDGTPLKQFLQFKADAELYIRAALKKDETDAYWAAKNSMSDAPLPPPPTPTPTKPGEVEFTMEDFPSDFTRFFECGNGRKYSAEQLLHTIENTSGETVSDNLYLLTPAPKKNCGPLCPCYLSVFPLSTCVNVVVSSYNYNGKVDKKSGGNKGGKFGGKNSSLQPDAASAGPVEEPLPVKQAASRVQDTVRILEGLLTYITDRKINPVVLDKCLRGIVLGSTAADDEENRQKDLAVENAAVNSAVAVETQKKKDAVEFQDTGSIDELEALLDDMDLSPTPAPAPPASKPVAATKGAANPKLTSLTQTKPSGLKDIAASKKKTPEPPATWGTINTNVATLTTLSSPTPSKSLINKPPRPDRDTTNDLLSMDREKLPFGAILIFVAGWSDIVTISEFLLKHPVFGSDRYNVIPLHSTVPLDQQQLAFELPNIDFSDNQTYDSDDIKSHYSTESALIKLGQHEKVKKMPKPRDPKWKIIVSTNIAETSLTIADCLYVFDFGCHKEKIYNAAADYSSFTSTFISQSNCAQRSGRAGRVRYGYCFRFYDFPIFNSFPQFPKPEVLTTSIEDLVLSTSLLTLAEGGGDDGSRSGSKTRVSKLIIDKHENYLKQLSYYQQHQLQLFGNTSVESILRSTRVKKTPNPIKQDPQRYNCAQFLSLMPQPPPITNIVKAIHSLQLVNALDSFEHPTSLSSLFISLPLPPRLTKTLIISLLFGCFDHGLTAVSVLTSPPIFVSKGPRNTKITIEKAATKSGPFNLEPIQYNADGIMVNPFIRTSTQSTQPLDDAQEAFDKDAADASLSCFVPPDALRAMLSNATGSDVISSIHAFYAWLNSGQAYQDRRLFARNIAISHSACTTIAQTRKQLFELLNSHPRFKQYVQCPMLGLEQYQSMILGGPQYVSSLSDNALFPALTQVMNNMGHGGAQSAYEKSREHKIVTMDWISKLVIYTPAPKNYVKPKASWTRFFNPLNTPPAGFMAWNPPYYQESAQLVNELPHYIVKSIVSSQTLAQALRLFDPSYFRLACYAEADMGKAEEPTKVESNTNADDNSTTLVPNPVPRSNKGKPLSLTNSNNMALLSGILATGQSFALRDVYNLALDGKRNPYSFQQVYFPPIPDDIAPEDDTDPFATTAPYFEENVLNYAHDLKPLITAIANNPHNHSSFVLDYPYLDARTSTKLPSHFSNVTTMNSVRIRLKDSVATIEDDLRRQFSIPGSLHTFDIDYLNLNNLTRLPTLPSAPNASSGSLAIHRNTFMPFVSYNECIVSQGGSARLVDCTPAHSLNLLFTNPNLSQIKHNYNVFHSNPYTSLLCFANYNYQHKLNAMWKEQLFTKYPHLTTKIQQHVSNVLEPNSLPVYNLNTAQQQEHVVNGYAFKLRYYYEQFSRLRDYLLTQNITTAPPGATTTTTPSTPSSPLPGLTQSTTPAANAAAAAHNSTTIPLPTPNVLICDYLRRIMAYVPGGVQPPPNGPQPLSREQTIDPKTAMKSFMTKQAYYDPQSPNQINSINKSVQDSILWLMISLLYKLHIITCKSPQAISEHRTTRERVIDIIRHKVTAPPICQIFTPSLAIVCDELDWNYTNGEKKPDEVNIGLELSFHCDKKSIYDIFNTKSAQDRPTPVPSHAGKNRSNQHHFDRLSAGNHKRVSLKFKASEHVDWAKKSIKIDIGQLVHLMQHLLVQTIYSPAYNASFQLPRLIAPGLLGMNTLEQVYTTEMLQTNITRLVQAAISPDATVCGSGDIGSTGGNSHQSKSSSQQQQQGNDNGGLSIVQHHWNHYLLTQLAAGVSHAASTDLVYNSYHHYLQAIAQQVKIAPYDKFQLPQIVPTNQKFADLTAELSQIDTLLAKTNEALYPMIDTHGLIGPGANNKANQNGPRNVYTPSLRDLQPTGAYQQTQTWGEYLENVGAYNPYYNATGHLAIKPETVAQIKQELPLYLLGYLYHYFNRSCDEKLEVVKTNMAQRDQQARNMALARK